MKKTFLIFSILAIIFGGLGFYFMSNAQEKRVVHEAKSHKSLTAQINIENQPIIGDPNAPVTMVEFFDLKCPFCLEWKKEVFPKLKEKYIDTHKAKIVFINAPLKQHGKDAYLGALALEAAYRGTVRKMRIYNAKPIFKPIPPFLTTLRKFQWS